MPLTATLLSTPTFSWHDQPVTPRSRKALALLCYLAFQCQAVSREQLAELLWGAGKLGNVRQALYELRQLAGADDWLYDESEQIVINAITDIQALEQALSAGDMSATDTLYKAPLLAQLTVPNAPAFNDWLELERERLNERVTEFKTAQLAWLEQTGHFEDALTLARALLAQDSFNETLHRDIMRIEYQQGNSDKALEQFESCRDILQRELGVAPLPETLELLAEIEGGRVSARQAIYLTQESAVPSATATLIGRDQHCEEALVHLQAGHSVLIHGFGGMGKSAVAASIAQTWLQCHRAALWLEVGSDSAENVLETLVKPFGEIQGFVKATDKAAFVDRLLQDNSISLIVLDDLRNAYSLSQLTDVIRVPLLVTSRSRYPRVARVYLDKLPREASLALLSHYAQLPLQGDKHAHQLAAHLGDHAYALRLAGISLHQEQTTAKDLLGRIRHHPHELKLPPQFTTHETDSVARLLEVSLDPLSDAEYEAFLSFGALPTPSASPDLIARLNRREPETTENALFSLMNRGLAERSTQPGSDLISYRLHDLSHAYAKANTALRRQTAQRACLEYLHEHKDDIDCVDLELTNLLGTAEASPPDTLTEIMWLLTVEGSYYTARGHSSRSIKLLETAVNYAKRLDNLRRAHYLAGRLGDVHTKFTGNYTKALKAYEDALELAKRDNDTGREAVFLSMIGIVYHCTDDARAEHYLDKAYTLVRSGGDLISHCAVLEQRAYFLASHNNWKEAHTLFQESLELVSHLEDRQMEDPLEISRRRFFALLNLGESQSRLGQFAESLKSRQAALTVARSCKSELWEANALQEIGELYSVQGKREQAKECLTTAAQFYEKNDAKTYVVKIRSYMQENDYL
jgi:DNA-binding SARP family transcriptional activator